MKISTLALLGGAGIAIANPLRVVVVDGGARPRFGLAAADRVDNSPIPPTSDIEKEIWKLEEGVEDLAAPLVPEFVEIPAPSGTGAVPCHKGRQGSRLDAAKEKVAVITNFFKAIFGGDHEHSAPPSDHPAYRINTHVKPVGPKEKISIIKSIEEGSDEGEDVVHILPFMPGPALTHEVPPVEPSERHHHHHHHGSMWHHRMRQPNSFISRLHRALHSLSPWEGRALAFVVGCGIGVLLRMVWVFMILFYRHFIRQPNLEDSALNESDTDDEVGDIRGSCPSRRRNYMPISPPDYEEVREEKIIPVPNSH